MHNEALQLLDALVAASVEELPRNDPPTAPADGSCYIVGDDASGAWAGHPGAIASFSAGGWRFTSPVNGLAVHVRSEQLTAVYQDGSWECGSLRGARLLIEGIQVVGERSDAISEPAGGSVVDVEAREALAQILTALRQHGLIET